MTPQEKDMLQGLTDRINNTQLTEKDPEAEQFLQQSLGRNPDALYIAAQTILVQQYALEQSQKQLADAKAQLEQAQQQPRHTTTFLGNLLGIKDDPAPPTQPQYTPVPNPPPPAPAGSFWASRPGYAPQQSASPPFSSPQPPPQYAQPQYGQPQYAPPQSQSGGFLRSAMTTAAGVAAGALAFEGIESLMHGFEHQGGYGNNMGNFGGGGGAPREEVINNYYGDSSPSEHHEHTQHLADSTDVEDRTSRSFADTDASDSDSDGDTITSSDDSSSSDSYDPGGNDDNF